MYCSSCGQDLTIVKNAVQADNDGDIAELRALCVQLRKQQKQVQSRGRGRAKKDCPSGSDEAAPNGNGRCSLSEVKASTENGSSEQIENVVSIGNGPSNGLTQRGTEAHGASRRESTSVSNITKKSQNRKPEDEEPKSSGRKRTRAPLVELPRRVPRTRGCKEPKVTHVDLSSDDDFQ